MRIFIGIKLDESSQKQIEESLKPFKTFSTPLKWIRSENLHLTLKFLGAISSKQLDQVIYILENLKFFRKNFEVNFRGFGKFGKMNQINILWVGIDEDATLVKLFETIELSLHSNGFDQEVRKFKPHLTVARNKKQFNFESLISILEANHNKLIHKMKIKTFQIFKSTLTPTGPVYSIIKEIPVGQL